MFVCFSVDLVLSSHIVYLILARARVLAMARCLSVCLCPSVRPSQVGVLSKRMDGQSCFFGMEPSFDLSCSVFQGLF